MFARIAKGKSVKSLESAGKDALESANGSRGVVRKRIGGVELGKHGDELVSGGTKATESFEPDRSVVRIRVGAQLGVDGEFLFLGPRDSEARRESGFLDVRNTCGIGDGDVEDESAVRPH